MSLNNAHIRFTPFPGQEYDLSGFLMSPGIDRYIVSQEQASSFHLHICLETDACEETIRSRLKYYFNIQKVGRGKGNTNYCMKWNAYKVWNPEYVVKSGDIKAYRGYTDDEIEDAIWRGSIKYNKQTDVNSNGTSIDLASGTQQIHEVTVSRPARQPQCEWDRLLDAFEKSEYRDLDCVNIKRWIKSQYLKQRKPIPREGDLRRYAYSLYAIVRNKTGLGDQQVLEETQEIYL